ncbi:hypothetical protein BYT27DRAFT_6578065 [Phlegmacium glaucopus]|nr:hypothetical protein BYT27DRAFT_6578065 [Phlegmacium glaucopus]
MMAEQSIREFRCLVEGDNTIFKVGIAANKEVSDLKDIIHERGVNVAQHPILTRDLKLLKVNIDLDGQTRDSLRQLAIKEDDGNQMLEWKWVSELWQEQPAFGRLHILVKLLPTTATISPRVSNKSNASSVSSIPDDYFSAIYQMFWQRGEHLFVRRRVQIPNSLSSELDDNLEMLDDNSEMPDDDSEMLDDNSEMPDDNSEMLELVVIDLPEGSEKAFTTEVPKLLVVPIYETFWDVLTYEDRSWQALLQSPRFSHPCHATIVTAQPGIGQKVSLSDICTSLSTGKWYDHHLL